MNLIFDYDGTINNCLKTYRPAFYKAYSALVDEGIAKKRDFSDREISYWLGFTADEMWKSFMPSLSPEKREECKNIVGIEIERQLSLGNAEWYTNAASTLLSLRRDGHTLIFLSNCRTGYLKAHDRVFDLKKYFDAFYWSEQYGTLSKYEIFRRFKDRYSGGFIVIGDRFHDIETAVKNNLPSVGCSYGYGSPEELSEADILIDDISQLPDAINKIILNKSINQ